MAERGAFRAYTKNIHQNEVATKSNFASPPSDAPLFTPSPSRKRSRNIANVASTTTSTTMNNNPRINSIARSQVTNADHQNSGNNYNSSGPLKKRQRSNQSRESTDAVSSTSATKTQNGIKIILRTLEDYCNGSNGANFFDLEHIPKLLLGVVGSHCETDPQTSVLAAKGSVQYASGTANGLENATKTNRNNLRRRAILPELFGKALRSGGTEHALQAIQKLGLRYWNGETSMETTMLLLKDTLLHCWKLVLCGIQAGLSRRLLLLIAQACLADLDEIDAWREERTMERHMEVLLGILKALSNAMVELPREFLAGEQHAILRACLSLLSIACMSGVENGHGDNTTTITDGDTKALSVIEEVLGILVICAQKRLLLRRDYERLVPACSASLSRFVLSSKCKTNHNDTADDDDDDHDMTRSIPIRVVQLIEAEDATVGQWLRQTYGIPPPHLIGNVHRPLQDSLISTMMRQQDSNDMRVIPNRAAHSPPMVPPEQPRHTFRNILVAAPDSEESSSDEDEDCWLDHDKEDEGQDDEEVGKTVIDNGKQMEGPIQTAQV